MDHFTLIALCMSVLITIATTTFLLLRRRTPPSTTVSPPPSPPSLPLLGHLHLLTSMPHHTFFTLSSQLGPIFLLKLGRVNTLIISSPQLAEHVLKNHDHVFANRPQLVAAQYLSFGCSDVTFSPNGLYWRQARKICVTELLSPRRVNSFQVIRDSEVNSLVDLVRRLASEGLTVDMSECFFKLANNVLCRVAFGKRFMDESGDEVKKKKGEELVRVLTETQELLAGFSWGDFYPEWGWVNVVSGMKRRLMRNLEDLRGVCDDIIDEHLEKERGGGGGGGGEDFVDVLLRVQRRPDLEVPITDDNLKALVLVISASVS